jgi:prepilin signal peptidase PulO-like enzyme (type II secretory pathway)
MTKVKEKKMIPYLAIPIVGVLFLILKANRMDPFKILLYMLLIIFAHVAAVSDIKTKKIPNELILAMLAAWTLVMVPKIVFDTSAAIMLLRDFALGFLIGGGMFMIVYFASRKGLGGGDVKLMAATGLYLGVSRVFTAMFYGTTLAAITGLVLILFKKIGRKDAIPLAPFLYIGILISVFTL